MLQSAPPRMLDTPASRSSWHYCGMAESATPLGLMGIGTKIRRSRSRLRSLMARHVPRPPVSVWCKSLKGVSRRFYMEAAAKVSNLRFCPLLSDPSQRGLGLSGDYSGGTPERGLPLRLFLHAAAQQCAQRETATAPAPPAALNTHSDRRPVPSPADAAARPSTGFRLGEHPSSFGLKNPNQGAGLHVGLVLGTLLGGELALVAFSGQRFHPCTRLLIRAQSDKRAGCLQPEATADRLQHLVQDHAAMCVLHDNTINAGLRKATPVCPRCSKGSSLRDISGARNRRPHRRW